MNRKVLCGFVVAGVSAMLLAGCAGTGTHPGGDGTSVSELQNPNQPNNERVMITALQHVILRHRPGGSSQPIAINLPPGMRKANYERVARDAGPNVFPLTEEIAQQGSMPIFHVGRVWLRFQEATVDIFRPLPEIGTNKAGQFAFEPITIKLQGGLKPWRVLHARAMEPGSLALPTAYFLPREDDPNHWRNWKQAELRRGETHADDMLIGNESSGEGFTTQAPEPIEGSGRGE